MRNGSIATLVDTNVLVYAIDPSDSFKQRRATMVLAGLESRAIGALSVQVLNEFFVAAVRKPVPPLSVEQAAALVTIYAETWPILDLTPQTSLEAIRGLRRYQLAFWDALIWASARLHRIPILLTEDGPTGATIDGVRWVNPFDVGFDIAML